MSHPYNNAYSPDNVYGHVVSMLRDLTPLSRGIHLDLGCGFGSIATEVRDRIGRHYVGIDIAKEGLGYLSELGFEVHAVDLDDEAVFFDRMLSILGDRALASISMIDVLEHLPRAAGLLREVRRLVETRSAILVISVPNVAHHDVSVRLMFGDFIYTESGLLDHSHVNFFTSKNLTNLLLTTGWHQIAANDVVSPLSDQHFPRGHIGLSSQTPLGSLLKWTRESADPFVYTNQLVRACLPGPQSLEVAYETELDPAPRPFLSVVIRTQGKRPDGLRDVLLCLTGQTDTDFEVVVVGHKLDLAHQLIVERMIADTPASLRERIRLVKVDMGTRAAPLNAGFLESRGQFVATLDDDDLVFGHWVETFHELAGDNCGKILRAVCVSQATEQIPAGPDGVAARATGGFDRIYPERFDFFQHLPRNHTPCMSVAYPRSVFHDLGLRFDERLTTTEDWDFLMRAAVICGVASSPEITSVYRKWSNRTNSQTQHDPEEWRANEQLIRRKLDSLPIVLPPGALSQLRVLIERSESLERANREAAAVRAARADPSPEPVVPESTAVRKLVRIGRRLLPPVIWDLVNQIALPGLQSATKASKRADLELISRSELCDPAWYLKEYPDVAVAGVSPAEHYLTYGGAERRNPGPRFDTGWYVEQYADVADAGVNPLVHYLKWGASEGREIRPVRF